MKRPRLYPLFDTCPGALSFFFFSGRATCMYHQSQATKVHVVYCFFIARPVLLHTVGMGYTNQTSHLFLKPELRYRNAILLSMATGREAN